MPLVNSALNSNVSNEIKIYDWSLCHKLSTFFYVHLLYHVEFTCIKYIQREQKFFGATISFVCVFFLLDKSVRFVVPEWSIKGGRN